MPWHQGQTLLKHVPEYESYLFEQWEEECFSDYWQKIGIYARNIMTKYQISQCYLCLVNFDAYVSSTLE
ncbi:hypothetical protein J4731_06920 [Providencia rettgeri]|nr:hypothetical protein [Providencia rettgeri]